MDEIFTSWASICGSNSSENMIAKKTYFLKRLKIPKTVESFKRIYQINRLIVILIKLAAVVWNPKDGTIQN